MNGKKNRKFRKDLETIGESILQYARNIFDVAGTGCLPGREDTVLTCGLEQTPEVDLDDFSIEFLPEDQRRPGKPEFRYLLSGFARFVQPKLDLLGEYIAHLGYRSEILGTHGYPNASMPLKQLAVAAGFGLQGKHTVLLHPKFGPWLRFAALSTDAPLPLTGSGQYLREENPLCQNCSVCLEACPVEGLLNPYRMENPARCLASFNAMEHLKIHEGKVLSFCMKCIQACPIAGGKPRRPVFSP